MASLVKVLQELSAQSPEERSLLQSLFRSAVAVATRGQKGISFAVRVGLGDTALSQLLSSLTEEGRTQFFGLVEALEIYEATHGSLGAVATLSEGAVEELRQIREICLAGGAHASY